MRAGADRDRDRPSHRYPYVSPGDPGWGIPARRAATEGRECRRDRRSRANSPVWWSGTVLAWLWTVWAFSAWLRGRTRPWKSARQGRSCDY